MEKRTNQAWWSSGLKLFAQMSGWIVVPILAGIYLGRFLDEKYNTEPWLFLASVGIAFIITNIGIVYQAKKSINQITKQATKIKSNNKE
jgi:F0F1-type ATP synthase assembly protein I